MLHCLAGVPFNLSLSLLSSCSIHCWLFLVLGLFVVVFFVVVVFWGGSLSCLFVAAVVFIWFRFFIVVFFYEKIIRELLRCFCFCFFHIYNFFMSLLCQQTRCFFHSLFHDQVFHHTRITLQMLASTSRSCLCTLSPTFRKTNTKRHRSTSWPQLACVWFPKSKLMWAGWS